MTFSIKKELLLLTFRLLNSQLSQKFKLLANGKINYLTIILTPFPSPMVPNSPLKSRAQHVKFLNFKWEVE